MAKRLLSPGVPRLAFAPLFFLLAACGQGQVDGPSYSARHIHAALRLQDPLERAEHLARALRSLPEGELPEVLLAYDEGFFDRGDTEIVLLAEWWSGFDGPGAAEWALSDWRYEREPILRAVVRGWARQDPEAALRWLETLPGASGTIRDGLISGWEAGGHEGLFEYVRAMPPGTTRQRALMALARRKVLRVGVAEAFDWANALPDDEDKFKLNLMRRWASVAGMHDPEVGAERAASVYHALYADGVPRRLTNRWARRDGEAAMNWVATLPEGFPREEAIKEAFRVWMLHDRVAAIRYMVDKDAALFDPARAILARATAGEDPEQALATAISIANEELRWPTVIRTWRNWWVLDSDAADAWRAALSEDDIPELYREKLRQIPRAIEMRKSRFEAAQDG